LVVLCAFVCRSLTLGITRTTDGDRPSFFFFFPLLFFFVKHILRGFGSFQRAMGECCSLIDLAHLLGRIIRNFLAHPTSHPAPPRPREGEMDTPNQGDIYLVPLRSALVSACGMLSGRWQPMH
jgi:hypothetical protein